MFVLWTHILFGFRFDNLSNYFISKKLGLQKEISAWHSVLLIVISVLCSQQPWVMWPMFVSSWTMFSFIISPTCTSRESLPFSAMGKDGLCVVLSDVTENKSLAAHHLCVTCHYVSFFSMLSVDRLYYLQTSAVIFPTTLWWRGWSVCFHGLLEPVPYSDSNLFYTRV